VSKNRINEDCVMSVAPVRREIVVEASQARAFRVFTEEHGAWWPLASHHIGEKAAETAIIEPRAGGRWFERAEDGTECPWGKVLVWDPPGRIVLSWAIGADFKYDPVLSLEVEIRFVALGPASTRIELEHRNLERLGDAAETLRSAIDSEAGWTGVLKAYAARVAG
jgi:uncharacterized protein YndB with AHSA1/START domain